MVKKIAVDKDVKTVGKVAIILITDSYQYEVEFFFGTTEVLTENIIADNLLAQVDKEGHPQILLSDIMDYRKIDYAASIKKCIMISLMDPSA